MKEQHIKLNCMDFRKKMDQDIKTNNGYLITDYSIKKNLLSEDGLYSPRFGGGVSNDSSTVYRCKCGDMEGKVNEGISCVECGTVVQMVDNIAYTGWLELTNGHKVIHPNLYMNIASIIGNKQLDEILKPGTVDIIGNYKTDGINQIGLPEFIRRFDEILAHFIHKKRNNQDKMEDFYKIQKYRDIVFIDCIPVFSTILRPISLGGMAELEYTSVNAVYTSILRSVKTLNHANARYSDKIKEIHQSYALQQGINKLYDFCADSCNGKMGQIRRNVLGARLNYTSRNVITPLIDCKFDEVTLPYMTFIELFKPEIMNILIKTEPTVHSAAKKFFKATLKFDPAMYMIMKSILRKGAYVVINRNPSIHYYSIMHMRVKDVTDSYVMQIPLNILRSLAADFDGDVLNILAVKDKAIDAEFRRKFNPRSSMMINRMDGRFNSSFGLIKNQSIIFNQFNSL